MGPGPAAIGLPVSQQDPVLYASKEPHNGDNGDPMRCFSWNVNGIRAVQRKNQLPWDVLDRPDVIGLQETKAKPEQLDAELLEPDGWHAHWHSAERPGYSGVAIYTRDQPDEVIEGLGNADYDCEGRVLSVRFGNVVITSAYFPNSQELGKRLAYKLGFCANMERFLAAQRKRGYETLLLGDYNIAHKPIDLARPKDNDMNPGYLPEERAWMDRFLGLGYRDVFRENNPELTDAYTWWTMRGGARARNVGWRIDYGTVSPGLADRVSETTIHPDIMGSDHCPVGVELR
jgi:exodeoxyribonuclease III